MNTVSSNSDASAKLFALFESLKIEYRNYPHEPVMTCAAMKDLEIPAPLTKSLFLKDKKGKFWLIAALQDTKIELNTVAKVLNVGSLRFADETLLMKYLGVKPGAVTIFGLINDTEKMVNPIIDAEILKGEKTSFHPLHNEATTVIASKDLIKFIEGVGRQYRILTRKELSS